MRDTPPEAPSSQELGQSDKLQLAEVLRFFEQSAVICEDVCRIVLERETEVRALEDLDLAKLSLLFVRLAEGRPGLIPNSVLHDVEAITSLRARSLDALREPGADAQLFVGEVQHRNHAKEIWRWFHNRFGRLIMVKKYFGYSGGATMSR